MKTIFVQGGRGFIACHTQNDLLMSFALLRLFELFLNLVLQTQPCFINPRVIPRLTYTRMIK